MLGVLALEGYLTVGIVIPLLVSKASGDNGIKFRSGSGDLSGFVLDSLRGFPEIIQYGQGEERLRKVYVLKAVYAFLERTGRKRKYFRKGYQ